MNQTEANELVRQVHEADKLCGMIMSESNAEMWKMVHDHREVALGLKEDRWGVVAIDTKWFSPDALPNKATDQLYDKDRRRDLKWKRQGEKKLNAEISFQHI